jgi:hypothetical protein
MSEPLWTDQEIWSATARLSNTDWLAMVELRKVIFSKRNEYEAKLAELEAAKPSNEVQHAIAYAALMLAVMTADSEGSELAARNGKVLRLWLEGLKP